MRQAIEISVLGGRKEKNAFTISYSGKDQNIVMRLRMHLPPLIEENLKVRETSRRNFGFWRMNLLTLKANLEKLRNKSI
jgi:hypothetical protein